jgi:altronate hydrolase/altronate dehydratase small subunit
MTHDAPGMPFAALAMHAADDVAVAVRPLTPGEQVTVGGPGASRTLTVLQPIGSGHKFALRAMPAETRVRKFGEVIGKLTAPVEAGEHVHVHNLISLRGQ